MLSRSPLALASGFVPGLALADASGAFRGARFRIDAYSTTLGRRLDLHEYPLRNLPNAEDLGRKARRFNFTAYVVGDTWQLDRDALLDACEADGPGLLVHPFHGEHMVMCEGCAVSETRASGIQYAAFDLSFVESGSFETPSQQPDQGFTLLSETSAAYGAAQAAFSR